MKKMFSSTKFLLLIAAIFSLFIVACLKEQEEKVLPIVSASERSSTTVEENSISCDFPLSTHPTCHTHPGEKITISVPSLGKQPACNNVKVSFDVVHCQTGGNQSFKFYNLQIEKLCPELADYFNSLTPEAREIAMEKFVYDASLITENDYVQASLSILTPVAISDFFSTLCYTQCIEYYEVPTTPGKDPKIGYKITKNKCEGDGCCQRTRTFTLNSNGTTTISKPKFTSRGSECDKNATLKCGKSVSKCAHTCGPI